MITETKQIYKCEFCRKLYQVKSAAERHEESCYKNPANNRMCFNCPHLEKKSALIYSGRDDYSTSEPVNVNREFFFCEKKQVFLYTPQNEIKGNYSHIDDNGNDFENYPMLKECELSKE